MSNAQEMEKRTVRRLQRSEEEKRRLVEETLVAGASVTAIAKGRGVNSSQLFKWRRQYQYGLLLAESDESVLLPVRISDEGAERRVKSKSESKSTGQQGAPIPATIHIEFARAQMRIEGAVDLALFSVLLEALAG